ncbi:MAG: group II intron reverse transcriptase/maturase, partial [Thermoplasmata archaeon]
METKLNLITEMTQKDKKCKFNNLAHLLNVPNLKECFYMLKQGKASGIDGVSYKAYEVNLESNLIELVKRMKSFSYRPQPVKRVYIPKSNGKLRPLGIMAIEDKVVQMGMTRILNAIYEEDFLDNSYGFRPNRNCHDALDRLDKNIMKNPVNYIIEADIKGFFDNVNQQLLMKCLEVRISDKNFLRLIVRFLKSGIIEDGRFYKTEVGTPQGGILSPVFANIYLHYVLDVWFEKKVKREVKGYIDIVRYADDFIICVQHRDEANKILIRLRQRLKECELELAEEKTRIIEFGKYAKVNAERKGERPKTFNFLGFTHYIDKTRKGRFKVGRKTERKKFKEKKKAMNIWLKSMRNATKVKNWWQKLRAKLRGHFRYYGVSGNFRGIQRFYYQVIKLVFKWLNRRSQKKSFNWDQFKKYLQRYPLPEP